MIVAAPDDGEPTDERFAQAKPFADASPELTETLRQSATDGR